MNWYYVEAGQQAGPVSEEQLAELVRNGKIQADTLVWHEGLANWVAYREVAPVAAGAQAPAPPTIAPLGSGSSAPAAGGVICSECGRSFPPEEVIRYGEKNVCAGCKPLFFQRLREGAPQAGAIPGMASEADVLARDYEVDIGASLSRGWEVFKANAGLIIGATVLVYLALMALNVIPYLSFILALLLTGPLMGGLWYFYVKNVRNQPAVLGDAFSGFGPRFWQLVLTQIIPSLVTFGCVALFGIVAALAIPGFALTRHSSSHAHAISAAWLIPLAVALVVAMVVLTFLNTCWLFALPLVSDKGLRFWPALELSRRVVMKHWWMTFFLLVVSGVLGILGVLACGFGLLVTGPVAFAMLASHYEKIFGDLAPQS